MVTYRLPYTASEIADAIGRMKNGISYDTTYPNLFTNQVVNASGTSTSANIRTINSTRLNVYVNQTGTSTNCTINIYGSPTETRTFRSNLAVLTLGANASASYGINSDWIPSYTWATITNNDTVNAANVTVSLEIFQATDV